MPQRHQNSVKVLYFTWPFNQQKNRSDISRGSYLKSRTPKDKTRKKQQMRKEWKNALASCTSCKPIHWQHNYNSMYFHTLTVQHYVLLYIESTTVCTSIHWQYDSMYFNTLTVWQYVLQYIDSITVCTSIHLHYNSMYFKTLTVQQYVLQYIDSTTVCTSIQWQYNSMYFNTFTIQLYVLEYIDSTTACTSVPRTSYSCWNASQGQGIIWVTIYKYSHHNYSFNLCSPSYDWI